MSIPFLGNCNTADLPGMGARCQRETLPASHEQIDLLATARKLSPGHPAPKAKALIAPTPEPSVLSSLPGEKEGGADREHRATFANSPAKPWGLWEKLDMICCG